MSGYVSLCDTHDGPQEKSCDVKAWRSTDGTYVAMIRPDRPTDDVPAHRIDILMQKEKSEADWATFFATDGRRREIIEASPRARIDHAKAGMVETYSSIQELRAALVTLKAERIWIPDRVFVFIDEQQDLFDE